MVRESFLAHTKLLLQSVARVFLHPLQTELPWCLHRISQKPVLQTAFIQVSPAGVSKPCGR